MNNQDSETRIIEPLAKFHAQVYRNGRIAVPKNERDYYRLDQHDIVELIIRKYKGDQIIGRGWFLAQLTVNGKLTIPIGFIRIEDVIGNQGLKIMRALRSNEYKLISEEDEKRLLSMLSNLDN